MRLVTKITNFILSAGQVKSGKGNNVMDEERFTRLKDEIVRRIGDLRELGQKLKIRSPAKLLAAARGKIEGSTLELAKTALAYETSKQVLAPKYRSTWKSAAEGPNQRLQADLIDFSQNTKTK